MMKKTNLDYVTPAIEVLELSIEQGFATSQGSGSSEDFGNSNGEW